MPYHITGTSWISAYRDRHAALAVGHFVKGPILPAAQYPLIELSTFPGIGRASASSGDLFISSESALSNASKKFGFGAVYSNGKCNGCVICTELIVGEKGYLC